MHRRQQLIAIATTAAALTGCATPFVDTDHTAPRQKLNTLDGLFSSDNPAATKPATPSNLTLETGTALSISRLTEKEQSARKRQWLSSIKVTILPAKSRKGNITAPADAIFMEFRNNGINIASKLPLTDYVYTGAGVKAVDAETALTLFLGGMGLDYEIDDDTRTVHVVPMRSQTWRINISNRNTSYAPEGSNSGNATAPAATPSPMMNGMGGGMPGMSPSSASTTSSPTGITWTAQDTFWRTIRDELDSRLTIMVPNKGTAPAPALAPANNAPFTPSMGSMGAGSSQTNCQSQLYSCQQVGRATVNPDTGSITVQAPGYLLREISKYLDSVKAIYNTPLVFKGRIFTLTTSQDKSEGFDIQAFAKFASGRYGALVANNPLGGVSISFPQGSNIPNATVGNPGVIGSGSLIGVASPIDGLQIINSYLSGLNNMSQSLDVPINAVNGSPARFDSLETRYWFNYTSQLSGGNATSGAIASNNNTPVPYNVGFELSLFPNYDPTTRTVRTHLRLARNIVSGYDRTQQFITAGDKITPVDVAIPRLSKPTLETEAVLKEGDIILIGGLAADEASDSENGVTGLKDAPVLGGFFGKATRNKQKTTTYIALQVKVGNVETAQ